MVETQKITVIALARQKFALDSNGGCFIGKITTPTLYLLPDGNIVSFRTDGTFLKMYPSAYESYYISN